MINISILSAKECECQSVISSVSSMTAEVRVALERKVTEHGPPACFRCFIFTVRLYHLSSMVHSSQELHNGIFSFVGY